MKYPLKVFSVVIISLVIGFYGKEFLPDILSSLAQPESIVVQPRPRELTEIHAPNHLHIIGADKLHKIGCLGKKAQVYVVDGGVKLKQTPYCDNYTQRCVNRFTGKVPILSATSENKQDHGIAVTSVAVGECGVAPQAALDVFDITHNPHGESVTGQLVQSSAAPHKRGRHQELT